MAGFTSVEIADDEYVLTGALARVLGQRSRLALELPPLPWTDTKDES